MHMSLDQRAARSECQWEKTAGLARKGKYAMKNK
jgi:hypothetical protein